MKRIVLALSAFFLVAPAFATPAPVHTKQVLSPVYTIDKKYRSMEGPGNVQSVYLGDRETPELLWIIGIHTEMVMADGTTPQLPELMCHVNVDVDVNKHRALFGMIKNVSSRLMTLSQGMLDARFPAGFGYPVSSNEPLTLYTQVLNHNIEHPNNMKVRHRITFEYMRDAELTTPMKALFNVGASGMVLLPPETKDLNALAAAASGISSTSSPAPSAAMSMAHGNGAGHADGTSCLMAPRAPNAIGMSGDYVDPQGRHMTGHWVIRPGREVNHSDVTWFMDLPIDTTLHYAGVHLHPYAESLELRDVTTNKSVFKSMAVNPKDKIGLDHVDVLSSSAGVPLYRNHKYELVSVYNNTTGDDHDSMASLYLGLADPNFHKPTPVELTKRALELFDTSSESAAIVHTSLGDFGIELLRDSAPKTARMIVSLMRAGAFTHGRIEKVDHNVAMLSFDPEKPEAAAKAAATHKLPFSLEGTTPHAGAMLTACPDPTASSGLTIGIVLAPSSSFDERCTVFAHVGPGAGVLRKIMNTPRDERGVPTEPIVVRAFDLVGSYSDFDVAGIARSAETQTSAPVSK
jgi:cyclophilin family peptidyl-prolyl cis-trans isomerase